MRIKICGITTANDARIAAQAGADFIGLNFHPASPRYVGKPTDSGPWALLAAVEPPAVAVAVTVNLTRRELAGLIAPSGIAGARPFSVVQLHGDEPPAVADYLIGRAVKVIKAFRVSGPDFPAAVSAWLARIREPAGLLAVLLDTAPPTGPGPARLPAFGGSGRRFNWEWIAAAREAGQLAGWPPLMLAGGLTSANVAKAIRIAQPWGVDVAGGVEVEDAAGIKSADRIRAFIRNARVG